MQTSFLLRGQLGDTVAVATIASDLREHKRLEAELEGRRLKLLQNSKLASLGEMASGIAHEINNPLAIIKGNVALMELQLNNVPPDLARLKKSTGTIDNATDRVATIIKGLRMFARDASADRPVNLALGHVLNTTLQFCQGRFMSHGIELRVSIEPNPLPVHGRETELAQAFLNLLTNAFDASLESTERWVEARLSREGDHAVLSIMDSGPGVPDKHRQRITEPFFTTKPVGKGTGLGLSVTQGIVSGHGGELQLKDGSPTTFVVRLPLA
jgi:C4-dicarboxylate-specific signal transduction histidine kinase